MKNRYKTSWKHPRSKHWHLLDYVIVRKSDLKFVKKTSARRGAECSTDHRLIASDVSWNLRPKPRRTGITKRKLNCEALQCEETRSEFQAKLSEAMRVDLTDSLSDQEGFWTSMSSITWRTAEETIGFKIKRHRDWFDENQAEIRDLLDRKNKAHDALLKHPSSTAL